MYYKTCVVCRVRSGRNNDQVRRFMAKFPKDEERCRQWVKVVGNEDLAYLPIEKLHDLKYVCGKHFKPKDFCKKKTRLKCTAVPSLELTAEPLSDEILFEFPLHLASKTHKVGLASEPSTIEEKENISDMQSQTGCMPVSVPSTSQQETNILVELSQNTSPSLHLNDESNEEENAYETETREQNEMIEKFMEETNCDETEIREQNEMLAKLMEETNKASEVQESNDDKQHDSNDYLSKLVPDAPNRPIIAPRGPTERRQYAKFLEQYDDSPKKPKVQEGLFEKYNKILQHDNAIYKNRISKLLANQDKLKLRIKELETKIKHDEEDFVTKVKETFSHVFTSNQVDILMGKKYRVWWNEVEYTKAYTLHHISKNAYSYVRDTLNYPFPAFSSLQQWAAKFGDEMPDSDDDEIKQPLPKRIKLTLDKTSKKYHIKKKVTDCAVKENELPSDTETVSDLKESGNEYLDINEDSGRNQDSDREDNVEATESDCFDCLSGDEMYEEIDYLDDHAEDENDGYIQDQVLDNDSDKSSTGGKSINNDIDDNNDKMDEQTYEIDEHGDEYFEELIIDNLTEHEDIENLNRDNSSVIEEDNG